jgi:hypothetical protein
LGDRLLTFDNQTASSIEILRFRPELANAPGFEAALRKRVEQIARLRHPSLSVIRSVESPSDRHGLGLVSTYIAGRRLSEILTDARGAAFALELIKQIAPALAALHQQSPESIHGVLTAERVIVTREGRLVIVEHALGSALQALHLPAARARSEFGVASRGAGPEASLDQRADVIQLGLIALSLLAGRRVEPHEYPTGIPALLDAFARADAAAAARLRPWLERALQLGERPFANAQEASVAFADVSEDRPAPAPAPEPTRPVLAFQKPDQPASPAKAIAPVAAPAPAETAPAAEPVTGTGSRGGAMKYVKWGLAVAAVLALAEGALLAGLYFRNRDAAPAPTETTATAPDPAATAGSEPAPPAGPLTTTVVPGGGATGDSTGAARPLPPNPSAPAPSALGTSATGGTVPATPDGAAAAPADPNTPATPAAPRFGGIRVTAPIDLQVFEGERLLGSTAGPIAIAEGPHTIEIVNEEFGFRHTQTITVRPGQMTPLAVALPNGKVSVNAVPWAEVWIDGKAMGETPLANLDVQIGRHEVVFRHPQLGEQRQTIVVKVEGLTRASATFQR